MKAPLPRGLSFLNVFDAIKIPFRELEIFAMKEQCQPVSDQQLGHWIVELTYAR